MDIFAKLHQAVMPSEQFMPEVVAKNQIVLHHTASGASAVADIDYWKTTKERVATAFVVARNGDIYQCFNSAQWACHLGVAGAQNANWKLDKGSIGIEIDSWGLLTQKSGKFYSWTGEEIPADKVQTYSTPFRGEKYFEKYTPEQIESTVALVKFLCDKFSIPKTVTDSIWTLSPNALAGKAGIYTHASYRTDKTDTHPQPEFVAALKNF